MSSPPLYLRQLQLFADHWRLVFTRVAFRLTEGHLRFFVDVSLRNILMINTVQQTVVGVERPVGTVAGAHNQEGIDPRPALECSFGERMSL